jgi:four helix bundle protein
MKITRFEDLITWQEARKLTKMIYEITNSAIFNKDPELKRHSRRTAVSIMAGIAEGFGRYSPKDSKRFFIDSRGSVAELQSHLYVALDCSYLTKTVFDNVYNQTILVNKLINGLISSSIKLMNS